MPMAHKAFVFSQEKEIELGRIFCMQGRDQNVIQNKNKNPVNQFSGKRSTLFVTVVEKSNSLFLCDMIFVARLINNVQVWEFFEVECFSSSMFCLWPRVTAKYSLSKTAIKTSGLLCKTSLILNLMAIDKFRSKLVSSGLDKHTSSNELTHQLSTKSVQEKSIMFLQYRPQKQILVLAN